jgi:hypothetical protein
MTSEGWMNCWEGGWESKTSTIIGSVEVETFCFFFGDGSSSSSSTSSTVIVLDLLKVVDDPFWKDGNEDGFGGGLGDCEGNSIKLVSGDPLVDEDKWAGGLDLLLP